MLRDASWIVSAFIILTMALAGVCSRHIDKRNIRNHSHKNEKHYNNRPVIDEKPIPREYKVIDEKPIPREYKDPGEYIVDCW